MRSDKKNPAEAEPRVSMRGREWFDALRKEAIIRGALPRIAKRVVDLAEDGEMWAVQEIANRLDGKPKQAVEMSSDPDQPLVIRWRE
jgi:hypothetical protein